MFWISIDEPLIRIAAIQDNFGLGIGLASKVPRRRSSMTRQGYTDEGSAFADYLFPSESYIEVCSHLIKFLPAPWVANTMKFGSHGIVPKAKMASFKPINIVVGSGPKLF